jgi:cardiolipin synthase
MRQLAHVPHTGKRPAAIIARLRKAKRGCVRRSECQILNVPQVRENLVLNPDQRRDAVIGVIRAARRHLAVALFRCTDLAILNELAAAVSRGVRVEVLLSARARNWSKKLQLLATLLRGAGVKVHHYARTEAKYHAKYIVADASTALVCSLNFTRKCFRRTCDFLTVTSDPEIVSALSAMFQADAGGFEQPAQTASDRLILAPEGARSAITGLLMKARKSIRIIDHKLSDPDIVDLLEARRREGVEVEMIGQGMIKGLQPHGKLILIDESVAVFGSIALSRQSLDSRREVGVVIRDAHSVAQLNDFFKRVRS